MEGKTIIIILILIALAVGYVHYYKPDLEDKAVNKFKDITDKTTETKPAETRVPAENVGKPDCVMDTDCSLIEKCKTGGCFCSEGYCYLGTKSG